ncbi:MULTISPECIES: nitroreductase family protein [Actinomyces]|uniref:Nitroreductase family protein n=2 Tax=Actinomyces TaxID=1654 RepID=A0A853EK81_9ACTO|nr:MULTISPECIES: nitroreductase family protein [Actinomyces]MBF0697515.1 nitroreductase family protein [Actinomyces bowdenii]MDO5064872.1 nitroreductase family protein [Actinomyces bowdenii]NYS69688.1 nitroreductase family protein [Actinomyces bowdenii]BDA65046.1 NADPH-dependent oxidoreductase [Actinomyces capricornis]
MLNETAAPEPANPTLALLRERRSVRAFTGEHVPADDLHQILLATRQAPSSINAQGLSLVVVRDPQRIKAIAQIAGGQPQVAGADVVVVFVVDYHRTGLAAQWHGREQVAHRSAEGVLVGAVDAGIALATFQTAAHSLGYATTAIGGIRNDPAGLIELLGLPEHTFPVVATTLGVADPDRLPRVKPRMPLESYAMEERYDARAVEEGARAYDQALRAWWDEQGMEEMGTWSQETSRIYSTYYFPTVAATYQAQGLRFLDGPQGPEDPGSDGAPDSRAEA